MNGRTLTRIIVAAAAIGIGMGLLLQLVLSFPASGWFVIPAAVVLAALGAASQWEWVRDETRSSETSASTPPTVKEEETPHQTDRK